jgi:hypothetical protein
MTRIKSGMTRIKSGMTRIKSGMARIESGMTRRAGPEQGAKVVTTAEAASICA